MLVILSGVSGAGKDTIVKEVLKTNKSAWESISCTSRSPRPGEVDGRDYYFLSREEFEQRINQCTFSARHSCYHNHWKNFIFID